MRYKLGFLAFAIAVLLAAVAATFMAGSGEAASGKIDDRLLGQLSQSSHVNVFVKLAADADLAPAEAIANQASRAEFVHDALTAKAASSQRALTSYLDGISARHKSFWINNSVYVYGADRDLVETLAARSDVAYVRGDYEVPLVQPVSRELSISASPQAIEWGLTLVKAPDVWAQGNRGAGVVVANIDTGVRWTHDAIDNQYRGNSGNHNYNWWDPDETLPAPTDNNGHGTHTMGTIVGDDGGSNQIGVAPQATWIAAQGCDSNSCSDFDLTSSAQWIACPTRVDGTAPDCSKVPDVVNNSWAGGGGDNWYQSYVNSWRAAGIMPVFAIGNTGPSCGSADSPGDYKNVLAAGAIDINSVLASFSSKGPSFFKPIKPEVVAPGVSVRSSTQSSDTSYASFSGTSMAAPHLTGAIALMLADTPGTSLKKLSATIRKTATKGLPNPPDPDTCGGIHYTQYPNPIYGFGRINILKAVNKLP
jgi:subtilisin family serine protease